MATSVRLKHVPADGVSRLFEQALARQREGHVDHAVALYREVIGLQPRHAAALHLLGSILLQGGAVSECIEYLTRATEANPNVAAAHIDLAVALQTASRLDESLSHYDRALALSAGSMAAHFNRAVLLQQLGRLAEAFRGYDRALKLAPTFVAAAFNRAVVLALMQRWDEALAAYDHCIGLAPRHAEALTNRGVALLELRRPAEALVSFDLALRFAPALSQALNNRGNALRDLGRDVEAVDSFDRAISVRHDFPEAYRNRGTVLRKLRCHEAALASFDAALRHRPGHADTLLDRAHTLIDLRRYAEASTCLGSLLEVAPHAPYAQGLRLHVQALSGDWQDYPGHVRAVIDANDRDGRADFPFSFLSVSDRAAAQYRCARHFADEKYPAAPRPMAKRVRYRHRKIRISYVSGDFRSHAVSSLLVRAFELHDRDRFEVTGISLQPPDSSLLGRRVVAAFDTFIDGSALSDHAIAAHMREREVDIAIDLAGFAQGCRTAIFAARPAPVQVNFLGFPGTLGTRYMDYLIADEFLIPTGTRHAYAEKIVWLPDCFQPNDDRRPQSLEVPSRRELALPEFGLVLCCFNNSYKINPPMFDIWMRLLSAAPGAVLWLVGDAPELERNLRGEATRRGVDAHRLIFAPRVSHERHLARLAQADLFLDTLPFNAGSTASDALWSGVPVLTCAGEAMAARMAGSLLRALGIVELITENLADYESLALKLASDPELLRGIRRRIAAARVAAPPFDSSSYCRHLEAAYFAMWQRSEAGRSPEHIVIARRKESEVPGS